MATNKFKIGDKVRCIHIGAWEAAAGIVKNKEYTVIELTGTSLVLNEGRHKLYLPQENFILSSRYNFNVSEDGSFIEESVS